MNKLAIILAFFFCVSIQAQNSLVAAKTKAMNHTQKNIQVDDSEVMQRKIDSSFKENYQSSDFQYEVKISEKGVWDRFLEWLQQLFKKLFGLSDSVSNSAVDMTINIVSALLLIFVIYILVKSILNKEGQWIFGKSTTKKIVSYDDIELNLKHIDFEKLIKDTQKLGNNRLTIRYYYLWILKRMSEKSIIDWNPEKTNSDYLYEIKNAKLKEDFSYLSYLYNYIWYGEFELNEVIFENAKKAFEQTLKTT